MAARWNIPVITPVGTGGFLADKTRFPTLIRLAFGTQEFAELYLKLLRNYQWKHVTLYYQTDKPFPNVIGSTIHEIFRGIDLSLEYYTLQGDTFNEEDYVAILQKGNRHARVFLVFAVPDIIRKFLLAVHQLKYTYGEHQFIVTVPPHLKFDIWERGDSNDANVKLACESVLHVTLSQTFDIEYQRFKQDIVSRARTDYGFEFGSEEPNILLANFYDSMVIYGYLLNKTLAEGRNPVNGTEMYSRFINTTFPGISGRVIVNSNGDRYTDLVLYDMVDPDSGVFEIVGRYDGIVQEYIPDPINSIHWPGNKGPPLDVPICGFRSELCDENSNSNDLVIGLSTGFGVVFLISAIIVCICFQRWKENAQKDIWWWRIARDELELVDTKCHNTSTKSFNSRMSSLKSDMVNTEISFAVATYKGIAVQLKKLDIKDVQITRHSLREFKEIRDINQTNIVKVLGACLETNYNCIVLEHCSKGTLQDVLGNGEIRLDAHFRYSLAIDIAKGMTFIHQSPIHHHGNLSSLVCLIDNRFSVKITQFGLASVYGCINKDYSKQEYINECLWKAPEHLRSGDTIGSKEGDVYSFAIILQELLTSESPFSLETSEFGPKDVLMKVKENTFPHFRPTVDAPPALTDMYELMQRCWSEDPHERPTFNVINKELKHMATKFGDSGNLLDNLLRRMELYANNLENMVDEKTQELQEEKKRSEELLHQILPKSVADKLKRGLRVEPEAYECVTIYFSDICGFTTISARSEPMEVVDLLNDLYSCFDAILGEFDVYKVETIGDAYMVASGLPQRNGNTHAPEIARTSLALLKAIDSFRMRHLPEEKLRLRIGLHSGPVCAGVVGVKMPRYCLFGDTVNTASRMESHGEELKIHMSESTTKILEENGCFTINKRGNIEIKGKGSMATYWLLGEKIKTQNDEIPQEIE